MASFSFGTELIVDEVAAAAFEGLAQMFDIASAEA